MFHKRNNTKSKFKRRKFLASVNFEEEAVGLMNKIQQHLLFLEQKIDAIGDRLQERPFKERRFSKPFNNSRRYNNSKQGKRPRKRNFTVAVCADCNKECEVPFKPNAGRPVYCKECFAKRKR